MRNVGQTSHISVSVSQHAHWFTFLHPRSDWMDKQGVKELKALLGFAPGQVLQRLDCTRLDLARAHLSHPA